MKNCESCRFWSELVAKGAVGGGTEALCLASGPRAGAYTTASTTCEAWKSGHLGAVDDPHEDPARYEGQPDDREADAIPSDDMSFPLRLYVYNAEGRHNGGKWLKNDSQLETAMTGPVKAAIAAKREVRITDSGDFLVFHAQGGRIVFPTQEQIARGAP